jgi:glucose/arabinose dehydrogenase
VTAPRGSNDLYVVERTGLVWVLLNGTHRRADAFADFSGIVNASLDDNGLLSIAFSPNYATNHLLYIDYTDGGAGSNIRVDEFKSDGQHVIMSSQRHILAVFDPIEDHFGGQLQFGPDGKLYVSVGDGGCCGDPLGTGQPMNTFLGKLLATANPTAATPTWAIVANGLRNPWRFSFDRQTGDLYLADVGHDAWEEVDFRPCGNYNANFGWSR